MSPTKRAKNKTNISIWIDKSTLDSWDAYCSRKNITRTQLIIDSVKDRLVSDENLHDLALKIDRLAEIVSEFNPDAESLIAESKRLNSRGRIFEQIFISREMGSRREDIKGFSSFAIQQALEGLENDAIIRGDQNGRYWLREFYPKSR
jgi:hypothetical protein